MIRCLVCPARLRLLCTITAARTCQTLGRQVDHPNVPVLNGVAVVLEQQWTGLTQVVVDCGASGAQHFNVVVNDNAVLQHRQTGVANDIAVFRRGVGRGRRCRTTATQGAACRRLRAARIGCKLHRSRPCPGC